MFSCRNALLTLAVLLVPIEGRAVEKQWGGRGFFGFGDPDNWALPGEEPPLPPPGAGDDALFTPTTGAFFVDFHASQASNLATVTGPYRFVLNGNQYTTDLNVTSTGRLTLDGGTVLAEAFAVGAAAGDDAQVTVEGGSVQVTGTDGLIIGGAGRGRFTLTDGATLTTPKIQLGTEETGWGTLRMQNGSSLTLPGTTMLGEVGVGTVAVESGSSLTFGSVQIGDAGGLLVSGSDSSLTIQSGDVTVDGSLDVLDGVGLALPGNLFVGGSLDMEGSLTVAGSATIGRNASSTGRVEIDVHQPSNFVVNGDLTVGSSGEGEFTAEATADFSLRANDLVVGDNFDGSMDVSYQFGDGSVVTQVTQNATIGKNALGSMFLSEVNWENANDLVVGDRGNALLSVLGGEISTQNAYFGRQAGFQVIGELLGSEVKAFGSMVIGGSDTAAGSPVMLLVGQGATLAVGQRLTVHAGSTLFIDDGVLTSDVGPIVVPSPGAGGSREVGSPGAGASFDISGNVEFTGGGSIDATNPGDQLIIFNGATLKKSGGAMKTATINAPIGVADGSQIIVEQGTLSLRGGGQFAGTNGMASQPFIVKPGATLSLASSNVTPKTYSILSGNQLMAGDNGLGLASSMTVGDNAILSIAANAKLTAKANATTDGINKGFVLTGTGRIDGGGEFENADWFEWNGGDISVATFKNSGVARIAGSTPRVLRGRFENAASGIVNQDAKLILTNGARVDNQGGAWNIKANIEDVLVGGSFHNLANATFRFETPLQSTATTVDISTTFSNQGQVFVGHLPATNSGTGTLSFSGSVQQAVGDALVGGKWDVFHNGALDLKGTTIKKLGNSTGSDKTEVRLVGNGVFQRLELEDVRKNGKLTLSQTLDVPGTLVNRGSIDVGSAHGAGTLRINGDFEQRGGLDVGFDSTADSVEVSNGDVTLYGGSETDIYGQLRMFTAGKRFRIDGGKLSGLGTINGAKVEAVRGQLKTRASSLVVGGGVQSPIAGDVGPLGAFAAGPADDPPSFLTFGDGYFQGAEATLQAEIAGTLPGVGYGQLHVIGAAEFEVGASISLSIVDPNDPGANPNPFLPDVGDVFDLVVADSIVVPDENDLNSLLESPLWFYFQPSIFDLPDSRQTLRLTTVRDLSELVGDVNLDGRVDRADAARMAGNFGLVGATNNDLDNDGRVGASDLAILQANMGQTAAAASPASGLAGRSAAVPEPSSLLLAAAFLSMAPICRRWGGCRRTRC